MGVTIGKGQEDDSLLLPSFQPSIYLCKTGGREGPELVRGGCGAREGVRGGFFYFQPFIYLCRTGGREGPELVRGGVVRGTG